MGCWNATCAVTNLPIMWQDKVEVILIKTEASPDGSSFCYPYAYHAPIPLTFGGEYNDYGAVENCHGAALDIIVESIRSVLTEREPDKELRSFETGVIRKDFNIENLFKLDHEGLLYINALNKMPHDMRETHRITHLTVHQHVYDSIVNNVTLESWDTDGDTYVTTEHTLETYRGEYKQFIKDLTELVNTDDDMVRFNYELDGTVGKTKVSKIVSERECGTYSMRYPVRIQNTLLDMIRMDDDIEPVIDNAVQFYLFNTFMNMSRRSWHKPSGTGSQDSETKYQELIANLTLEIAKSQRDKYLEEYEE